MHHENIVHVSDVFEENGTAYYVMDFINGISLQDIVTRKGHISEHEAVNYILQISDALKYVHSKNRLHLDIKPGNIMIDESGKAILIDFGASKHYDEETGENTTTLLGINTKGYAPIEQISQSFKTFNAATDIYALGATLYKIITGKTPPDSLLIASGDVEKPVVSTNFSDGVRNAISKAMMPKRNDRPQTIEEFLAILTRPSAGNAYNVEDEATVCEETTLGTNPHYSPINKTPKPIHAEGQKPSFHWNRKWFRIGSLIVIAVIIGGLSYIIFGKGNGKTNSDSESIDLTYYTDLSKIAIGDYLYSDGRYTHDLDSSNIANCSGCVYNLTTTQDEKDSGWTHGHIVALKDAKNRKGESIFSWGPVNQSIPNTMDIDDAMKYKDGYWYCLLDSACQSPAISSIEYFDGKNFDVPLPEGSEWYVPTLSDWRDIIVNLGKGSLKAEHNTLACYDNSKVGPILEKKIGCFAKKIWKNDR